MLQKCAMATCVSLKQGIQCSHCMHARIKYVGHTLERLASSHISSLECNALEKREAERKCDICFSRLRSKRGVQGTQEICQLNALWP